MLPVYLFFFSKKHVGDFRLSVWFLTPWWFSSHVEFTPAPKKIVSETLCPISIPEEDCFRDF